MNPRPLKSAAERTMPTTRPARRTLSLPVGGTIVLQELPPHMLAGVDPAMIGSTIRAAPSTISSGG